MNEDIFSEGDKKLLQFPRKLIDWIKGNNPIPIALEIQPSEICNHYCPLCQGQYALGRKRAKENSRSGAFLDLNLLNSVWVSPPQGIILSGNTGDPLLHPNIINLLKTIFFNKIPTVLITNGEFFEEQLYRQILNTCQGIRISLDAFNSKSFSLTHGVTQKAWSRVLDNITRLISYREQENITPLNCFIGVGYLTGKKTIKGMLPATKLAQEIGVDYIHFRPYHYSYVNVSDELYRCKKIETDSFKVLCSRQKYFHTIDPNKIYDQCHGSYFYTVIDARGELYICCHQVGNPKARIGALAEQEWCKIMNSSNRKAIIQKFDVSNCVPFCRLNSQNELLERIVRLNYIPEEWIKKSYNIPHASFL